jgi:AcrR family transcriptional regulator
MSRAGWRIMLAKQKKQRRKPDERIRRTHQRLGSALVELIAEKPIDGITVQEVLDRASVGRSTFYLHFRDKNDLLLSQLEMFLETMSTLLTRRKEKSQRVVPLTEMLEHIGGPNNRSTVHWPMAAVSTISSISRKATSNAELSNASRNPSLH